MSAVATLARLLLDATAARRITRLVVDDQVMEPVRQKIWDRFPPDTTAVGYLVSCPSCTSVWAAALVRSRVLPRWINDILVISEVVITARSIVGD